jgi:hypothetical protein
MRTTIEIKNGKAHSFLRNFLSRGRNYLPGQRGLIVLVFAVIAAIVALNWSWLIAVGVAPILATLAPCTVMCTLGLCMNKSGSTSCSRDPIDVSVHKNNDEVRCR